MATQDPEFYNAPKFTPEPPVLPKQHGCFFYGCIIASILAVLFVILLGVIMFFAWRFFMGVVNDYTSTTPRELPKLEMPDEQRQTVKKRFDDFRQAVNDGKPTDTLVLTSDDINALIEEDPDLRGRAHVKIEGDEVKGEISLPLDNVGLKGRYLNGEAEVKASLTNGVLIVTLDSVEVNGKKVPEQLMQQFRQQNLVQNFYKDQKNAEMMRRLEKLEIKDGKITLKVLPKSDAPAGKPAETKEGAGKPPAADKTSGDQPKPAPTQEEPKPKSAQAPAASLPALSPASSAPFTTGLTEIFHTLA
jgi:hypothetical protein